MDKMQALTNEEIARVCHEANRAFCQIFGELTQVPWDDASDMLKASAASGVAKAKAGLNGEQLHDAWKEYKIAEGWVYGPEKDEVKKTHPCIVPYNELPEYQKRKDFLFSAIVKALS